MFFFADASAVLTAQAASIPRRHPFSRLRSKSG
jgi:hypothetical protein